MGSSIFSVEILRILAEKFQVVGVVTQPDKPAGRGKQLTSPPVKLLAQELQLDIFQPEKLKTPEAFARLSAWNADLFVVAAYGKILRQEVLDLPKFGCINVHASYLPRWRGASPIQAAILHGDRTSGVTIMKMDAGIDTGPELAKQEVEIDLEETSITLSQKLANAGVSLLTKTLAGYLDGSIQPHPQPETGATYAQMIRKEDGQLDFSFPARELERKVRAFIEWPGTSMTWNDQLLKIRRARVVNCSGPQGLRQVFECYPGVFTAEGALMLLEVQPAGRKWMRGDEFLRGVRDWVN